MEKVVLSKGYEFETVTDAIRTGTDYAAFTFIPGEFTMDQLVNIWEGNNQIKFCIDDKEVRVFNNFTRVNQMTLIPRYLIKTLFKCPECGVEVEPDAVNCHACNAAFERPESEAIIGPVYTVKLTLPDINDRMADAEDSIEDIINTILG